MSIIQTRKLAVGYSGRTVVGDINLDALKGQFICLLGPNGSGKSTIIRSLAGLLAPVKGSVFLKGQPLYRIEPKSLSRMMALVLTERLSPGLITVFDIAAMGRFPTLIFLAVFPKRTSGKPGKRCALSMRKPGERYFTELSDGEKQKS